MTPAGRFGSAARRTLPQSTYVCLQCRLRASTVIRSTNPSISLTYAARRHASWLDTDKLQKRIWGTETPPGKEDPYGKESAFDRQRREREQENEGERGRESVPAEELEWVPEEEPEEEPELAPSEEEEQPGVSHEHVPATAEGLERVGGRKWGKAEWKAENLFQGFGFTASVATSTNFLVLGSWNLRRRNNEKM